MLVLGVDPGLLKTGWGLVKFVNGNLIYVDSGTIFTDSKLPMEQRLKNIFDNLDFIMKKYNPDYMSIEETFVNNNPVSSLKLGQARGVAILTAGINNIEVFEYLPNAIKKAITGVGKATKEQMVTMIKCLLPLSNTKTEDEADALAMAICHINNKIFW
jgi:crossover junction endodeoxyribonuclease RuvC